MPVPLGTSGQPGFDQPIDLMKDCHRRIEHFLGVLQRVANAGGDLDDEHRAALTAALRYFHAAAPHHTADEEQSLFPRLRAMADRGVADPSPLAAALDRLAELEADHVRGRALHERIERIGRHWLEERRLTRSEAAELPALVDQLRAIYSRHIRIEDDEVFPAAAAALDAGELDAIGREMAQRRIEDPGGSGAPAATPTRGTHIPG